MRPKDLEKEEAIRTVALQIIAEDGLENLTMQRLAKAAHISPRTIYIKYENKEDLLIKLFIHEVLGAYEKAVLEDFREDMEFAEGVKKIWVNSFNYMKTNHTHFVLMQYGKSSPFLNKAFQQANIVEGHYFKPIHVFLQRHSASGLIRSLPFDVYRALLFSPIVALVNEFHDYQGRPVQIITQQIVIECCEVVIKGILN